MKQFFTRFAFAGAMLVAAQSQGQVILQDNFESTTGSAIPATWSQTTLSTDGGWKSGTGTGLSSQYFPIADHTRILATNDDGCNCDKSNDVLKTPSMDFSGSAHPFVSFDLFYREGAYQDANGNVFYESLLLEASTDGGVNWTLVDTLHMTVNAAGDAYAWNTKAYDLQAYAGQANVMLAFVYNDGGSWLYGAAIDNFKTFTPPAVDVALTAVGPNVGDPASYGAVGSGITFTGTLFNQGTSTLTSATVTYSVDGGAPVTYNLSGISVAPFTSYDFTISPAYTLTAGNHNVNIALIVPGDATLSDNLLSTTVVGAQFLPGHMVTLEEATGAWCGWCPRGAVYMDSIYHVHGNGVALIAVHDNTNGTDAMAIPAYNAGINTLISGYPSVVVERKEVVDPTDAFTGYDAHVNDFGFANLTATKTYNASTRALTVDVSANFAVDLSGNYRLALVLTEDAVHNTASGYIQTNYYSTDYNNLPLVGAGHNWQTEPGHVPAANMYYNFVARSISGGFTGQAGSLPSTIAAGSTQTYTFPTVTLDASWVDWNMKAVVLLIDATSGKILNSVNVAGMINGTNDVKSQIDRISLYPNPTEGTLNVLFSLQSQKNVTIDVTDVLGKVVGTYSYNNVTAGTNQVALDVANLANGVYFANVKTDSGMVSRKFIKE